MLPTIRGTIDRRILVNFRVDPEVVTNVLPHPFKPKLIHSKAMVGICLIRLKKIRPWFFPSTCGVSSESVAHRIAVEWEENGDVREGVYIPRRDTTSRLTLLAGG